MNRKSVLVTGSSIGLGASIIKKYASNNYDVVITYLSHKEDAIKLKEEVTSKYGVNALIVRCDISSENDIENLKNEILNNYGKLDVLVNNAGITRDGLFMRMSKENWDSVINTNLTGAFNVTQPVIKLMMKQRSGAIVNMASIVGVYGNAGQANYAAAKAGLIGFTKSLSKELASRNIRVNAVAPGFVQTDMTKGLDSEKISEHIPLKRLGEAQDIATAVKFLAVDAQYVTGQVLQVDGGLTI